MELAGGIANIYHLLIKRLVRGVANEEVDVQDGIFLAQAPSGNFWSTLIGLEFHWNSSVHNSKC